MKSLKIILNLTSPDKEVTLAPYAGAFFIAQNLTCGIVQKTGGNIMHDLKDRLKEPTSYLGLAAVFQGVGEC